MADVIEFKRPTPERIVIRARAESYVAGTVAAYNVARSIAARYRAEGNEAGWIAAVEIAERIFALTEAPTQ